MRDYGKVHTAIWASPTFKALSDDGRMLAIYLLTCSHQTIAGVFRLPDGYAAEDLDWAPERVRKGFAELFRNGFATRCERTKWVNVHKFLEWNPPENPNQHKAVAKCLSLLPKDVYWANPSGTLPEPFLNQEQEQEQEQKDIAPPPGEPASPPPATRKPAEEPQGFVDFWALWPKNDRKAARGKCLDAWRRHKCEPVAEQVLAHVRSMMASDQWREQGGKFIPAPLSYLNQQRWDGAEVGGVEADFWTLAGFGNRWEAQSAGCFARNASQFRDGKKAVAA
jgi:hypothetical protein